MNVQFKEHLSHQPSKQSLADSVSIKILNVAAWARTTERVPVTLPRELEDYIPEVEDFYKVCNFEIVIDRVPENPFLEVFFEKKFLLSI